MKVVTRFAPSPTGDLHIGSARTALFNYLFARHHQGKFLLRIEDTDQLRSSQNAVDAIINGLSWLDINWDDEVVFQLTRSKRHQEVAYQLIKMGKAYYCYMTQEELASINKRQAGAKFRSKYRDMNKEEIATDIQPVVRLKSPITGQIIIDDLIQKEVVFNNDQSDDMILLRSDGTPTYMLAVVVDDHDMGVTHIIRGDDHLNNAARQTYIYQAMGWDVPYFAHIPLIHGEDGAKLSKRHGALSVEAYQKMGYIKEAMCNYLLRLGFSHGNEEIIKREKAIEWFNLESIVKSPARLDFKKLNHVNHHYIKELSNEELFKRIVPFFHDAPDEISKTRIINGMNGLKLRSNTLLEIVNGAGIYLSNFQVVYNDKAMELIANIDWQLLANLFVQLEALENWQENELQLLIKNYCHNNDLKLPDIAQMIRIVLTGCIISPSIFEMMYALGKRESLSRILKYQTLIKK